MTEGSDKTRAKGRTFALSGYHSLIWTKDSISVRPFLIIIDTITYNQSVMYHCLQSFFAKTGAGKDYGGISIIGGIPSLSLSPSDNIPPPTFLTALHN